MSFSLQVSARLIMWCCYNFISPTKTLIMMFLLRCNLQYIMLSKDALSVNIVNGDLKSSLVMF